MEFESFDERYVRRLIQKHPSVEGHFTEYFCRFLVLKLRSRLRSREDCEDVLQETLLRVLCRIHSQSGLEHPERLGLFVNAVCNNVLREQLRLEARYVQVPEGTVEPVANGVDPDAPLITHERKQQVKQVLTKLSQKDRELLRMVFLDEADKSEACQRLGVDPGYLRVLIHRAKVRFRAKVIQVSHRSELEVQ